MTTLEIVYDRGYDKTLLLPECMIFWLNARKQFFLVGLIAVEFDDDSMHSQMKFLPLGHDGYSYVVLKFKLLRFK
jgi:hypothetical protein